TYFDYYWKPFEAAAKAAGVTPIPLPVGDVADIEQAFATRDRDDGLILVWGLVCQAVRLGDEVSWPSTGRRRSTVASQAATSCGRPAGWCDGNEEA
ncbi:MAG TPA: hypothetical protein VGM09_30150, partial [Bradyrhizobium sp.]